MIKDPEVSSRVPAQFSDPISSLVGLVSFPSREVLVQGNLHRAKKVSAQSQTVGRFHHF